MIKRYFKFLLYLSFLFCSLSCGVINAQKVFHLDSLKGQISLNNGWKFHSGDNKEWADSLFNDKDWDTISLHGLRTLLNTDRLKGIVWLRLHLKVSPALFHKTIIMQASQGGGSEIYLNNKLVESLGKVGDIQNEIPYDPGNNIYYIQLGGDSTQVLAVRYSQNKITNLVSPDLFSLTFSIQLAELSMVNELNSKDQLFNTISILMFAVFLTLCIFHSLLFIYYSKTLSNLYYSIFVLLISFCTFSPYVLSIIHNPLYEIYETVLVIALIAPLFFFIVLLLYTIFERKFNWFFWVLLGFTILTDATLFIKAGILPFTLIFTQTCSASVSGIVIIIKGLRRKQQGAWIVAGGFLIFLCLIPGLILLFAINTILLHPQSFNVNGILLVVWIFSIPASMSVYLASEFARTNKKLSLQLVHVKQLSEQNIEKEREKQQIIEQQNEMLEVQVKEKTSEIQEQKNELEQKNTEIIDSILYARRIQTAMLPTEESLKEALGDYFVVFKPKDVVSGDFYWCHISGDTVVFAVVDCTGHGVPGAFMSMIGNSLLNEVVLDGKTVEADLILNELRRKLISTLQQSGHTNRDGMDIALSVWNKKDNTLQFAGANNRIYVVRKNIAKDATIQPSEKIKLHNNHLLEIVGDKQPIGYQEGKMDILFTKHVIKIQPGDIIYSTSDGYVDQFGGGKDKKFTSKRLRDLLDGFLNESIENQRIIMIQTIENWRKDETQTDDICVIGIKML